MDGEVEHFFTCPYCFSQISMLFETFHGNQEYIEDCEVCCRPITVSYTVTDGALVSFEAKSLDD